MTTTDKIFWVKHWKLSKRTLHPVSSQSKRAFATNRLREWKKPLNGNAVRRATLKPKQGITTR